MLSIIAAIGENNELGLNGNLVFNIKEDMKFFKNITFGHPVLMGKKTFESIGRPLPGRDNYVAVFPGEELPEGVTPVYDLHAFLKSHQDDDTEYFVIGGATIYREALPYAKCLYLTEIAATTKADAFFPEFDKSKYQKQIIKEGSENDLSFRFTKYILI